MKRSETVPVQKAAYSACCSAVLKVASTAGLMAERWASSWVVVRVARMAVQCTTCAREKKKKNWFLK